MFTSKNLEYRSKLECINSEIKENNKIPVLLSSCSHVHIDKYRFDEKLIGMILQKQPEINIINYAIDVSLDRYWPTFIRVEWVELHAIFKIGYRDDIGEYIILAVDNKWFVASEYNSVLEIFAKNKTAYLNFYVSN